MSNEKIRKNETINSGNISVTAMSSALRSTNNKELCVVAAKTAFKSNSQHARFCSLNPQRIKPGWIAQSGLHTKTCSNISIL